MGPNSKSKRQYHKTISYFFNILTANKKTKNVCINIGIKLNKIIILCNYMGYGLYMDHILFLFTYFLTTSVSGRVPGYPSYYPTGTRVINYPDTAALDVFGSVVYLHVFGI